MQSFRTFWPCLAFCVINNIYDHWFSLNKDTAPLKCVQNLSEFTLDEKIKIRLTDPLSCWAAAALSYPSSAYPVFGVSRFRIKRQFKHTAAILHPPFLHPSLHPLLSLPISITYAGHRPLSFIKNASSLWALIKKHMSFMSHVLLFFDFLSRRTPLWSLMGELHPFSRV